MLTQRCIHCGVLVPTMDTLRTHPALTDELLHEFDRCCRANGLRLLTNEQFFAFLSLVLAWVQRVEQEQGKNA